MHSRAFWAILIGIISVSWPFGVLAQVARGNLTGRVTDQQGAVIAGAQVTATEKNTGAAYKGVSDNSGGSDRGRSHLPMRTAAIRLPCINGTHVPAAGEIAGDGNLNDLIVHPHNVNAAFDTAKFDRVSAEQPVTATHIRTLPSQVTNARQDGINSMDLSIIKGNRITETVNLQLRADLFNALNHPQFSAPNLSPTRSSFGVITSQANLPRTVQLAVRLVF